MSDAAKAFQTVLDALSWTGTDPELDQTAERFTQFLHEFTPGDRPKLSTFAVELPGPVVLTDLPFYSLCAHHLLPFFGTATVSYAPEDSVGGFSGIARLLDFHARRPQLQERLAANLADDLMTCLGAKGVRVELTARQLCMEMRGARKPGGVTVRAERGDVTALS